jgi:hypothetical protein
MIKTEYDIANNKKVAFVKGTVQGKLRWVGNQIVKFL